jgi:two-component system sensor histidine kinase PhoQ
MSKIRQPSLTRRLLFASLLILPLFLGLTGFFLDQAFRKSLLNAEQEKLKSHIYLMLTTAELVGNEVLLPRTLEESLFNQITSGLYAHITDDKNTIYWRSRSARMVIDELTESLPPGKPGDEAFDEIVFNNASHFYFSYTVLWDTPDIEIPLTFHVIHHQKAYLDNARGYRYVLLQWLGTATVFLVLTQLLILRWGLVPLQQLARDIQLLESGDKTTLDSIYTEEIQPVTDNFNRLIDHERNLRERYKNTLADLAHSLKTPLAVIRSSLEEQQYKTIEEQLQRMDDIISHQLRRAVSRGATLNQPAVDVSPLLQRLWGALQKVYQEKNIQLDWQLDDTCKFHGDEKDLMEVCGNLLDNACKYCLNNIRVSTLLNKQSRLMLVFEDDGKGISPAMASEIINRGTRLDSSTPGQGIGLHVAVDIIEDYEGTLEITTSDLGGARFTVTF